MMACVMMAPGSEDGGSATEEPDMPEPAEMEREKGPEQARTTED